MAIMLKHVSAPVPDLRGVWPEWPHAAISRDAAVSASAARAVRSALRLREYIRAERHDLLHLRVAQER